MLVSQGSLAAANLDFWELRFSSSATFDDATLEARRQRRLVPTEEPDYDGYWPCDEASGLSCGDSGGVLEAVVLPSATIWVSII